MALVVQNGALLKQGDALASGSECCCNNKCSGPCETSGDCAPGCACVNGVCCPANACCYWSCDYIAELVWPEIENPEDIPDVSEAMIAAGWVGGFFLPPNDVPVWVKTIRGEENCDDPENDQKIQQLQAEIDEIVGGLGGLSIVILGTVANGFFSGPGCLDCVTQQECEETYLGTFHAGKLCSENPCCSGACDEETPCLGVRSPPSTGWDCDCVGAECVPAENPLP